MLFQGQEKKQWVKRDSDLGFVFDPEEERVTGEASVRHHAGLHLQRRNKKQKMFNLSQSNAVLHYFIRDAFPLLPLVRLKN